MSVCTTIKCNPTIRKKNIPKTGDFVTLTRTGRVKKVTNGYELEFDGPCGIFDDVDRVLVAGFAVVHDDDIDNCGGHTP
jgi:hypothetical protein